MHKLTANDTPKAEKDIGEMLNLVEGGLEKDMFSLQNYSLLVATTIKERQNRRNSHSSRQKRRRRRRGGLQDSLSWQLSMV